MQTSEKWSVTVFLHAHTNEVNNSTQKLKSWKMKESHHTHPTQRESGPTLSFFPSLSLSFNIFLQLHRIHANTLFSLFTSRVRKCWYWRSLWCYRVTLYSLQQHPYFSFISLPLSHSLSLLWGFSLFLSISNTKIVKLFSNIRQFHIFLLKCS